MNDGLSGIILLFALGALYFLPTIIAARRDHHQVAAIFVLNLFLGWSGLGWIAALVWSSTAIPAKTNP